MFEKLKFWKKKSVEVVSSQIDKSETKTPFRCYVNQIIKDLNPNDYDKWSYETGEFNDTAIYGRNDRKYKLYVGGYLYYTGGYYIELHDVKEIKFTEEERKAVSGAYIKMINFKIAKQKESELKKDEEKLKVLFPECYPSQKTKKATKK